MAHFARIDDAGQVLEVLVVANADCGGGDFPQSEPAGQAFLEGLGLSGRWLQTSYSRSFRGHYAGPGYSYRPELDAFIPPQPFPSWLLDVDTLQWEPPVPPPDDGEPYEWNESTQTWEQIDD